MPDKVFIDSNIILYLYSEDELFKQHKAQEILDIHNNTIISTQVINEVSNVLFKKFRLSAIDVEKVILEIDKNMKIVDYSLKTQINAVRLKDKYGFQYYDALIVSTALEQGCSILFSEDMQNNQIINNSLQIINPFHNYLQEKDRNL